MYLNPNWVGFKELIKHEVLQITLISAPYCHTLWSGRTRARENCCLQPSMSKTHLFIVWGWFLFMCTLLDWFNCVKLSFKNTIHPPNYFICNYPHFPEGCKKKKQFKVSRGHGWRFKDSDQGQNPCHSLKAWHGVAQTLSGTWCFYWNQKYQNYILAIDTSKQIYFFWNGHLTFRLRQAMLHEYLLLVLCLLNQSSTWRSS